ncbi:MAG: hypothetical protein AB8F95_04085 [Bacteroidia bacterium]
MKQLCVLILLMLAFAFGGYSQCATELRLTDILQQERIDGGVKSGKLTRREGRKLQTKLFKLRKKRMHYMADGKLSHRERRLLGRKHRILGALIYKEKHDVQRAR